MYWKNSRIKLSYSFIGLFLIATVLLGLMLFTSHYHLVEKVLKETSYRNQSVITQKQLEFINSWYSERKKDMVTLVDTRVVYTLNKSGMAGLFENFTKKNPEYERIAFVGLNGKIEVNSKWKNGISLKDRDYFKAGLEGQYFISQPFQSTLTGKPIIIFTEPVKANERVVGVMLGVVNLDTLNDIMIDNHSYLDTYLVNMEGYLITNPKYSKQIQGYKTLQTKVLSEGVKKAMVSKYDTGEYQNYAGDTVLGSYRLIPEYKWIMVAEINNSDVLQSVQDNQRDIAGLTFAVILAGVIPIGIFFSYLITKPVKKLTNMVNNVSRGKWDQRVKVWWSFREIATLAEAINRMAEIIEKNEEEIQANHEELLEKNRLLEQLAITDHLTQVYNRRYILGRMPSELAHANRYGEQITTIMLDLDYFKKVNDTFGHNVGDQALLGVVEVIKQTIRKADILGRWGGEEFILICPNTGLQAAVALAERIRTKVEEVEFTTPDGVRLYLSLSMGVSAFCHLYPTFEQDIEDMIIRADKALYKAKHLGRNRVEVDEQG